MQPKATPRPRGSRYWEAREMVLSQILFSHSLERSKSHLKCFEVHLLFPLFFSECHRDDANLPDCGNVFFYYSCSCFPVGTFKECLEDVILRAAQMEQIVEKVCEERLNTGAVAVIAQAVEHEDNHGIEDERKVFKNTTEEVSHKIQTPQKK
ncbi:unnamed protein product [Brassica napus]|uniref:Uncharacterized protein n=2 Tax=Brassica TaxID=3705 RepID=M4CW03_BRACM|nr:unnamed protein product [Brassica napus]VDC89330.1 unnamed protein product [Brassica rapa]